MSKIFRIKCKHCGKERMFELRKDITKSYAMCFQCGKRFKVHTHISKYTQIVTGERNVN